MYKTTFYKAIAAENNNPLHFEEATGWGDVLEDSAGNLFEVCFSRGITRHWYATERTTGLRICQIGFPTIKETKQYIIDNYLDKIYPAVKNNPYVELLSNYILSQ